MERFCLVVLMYCVNLRTATRDTFKCIIYILNKTPYEIYSDKLDVFQSFHVNCQISIQNI